METETVAAFRHSVSGCLWLKVSLTKDYALWYSRKRENYQSQSWKTPRINTTIFAAMALSDVDLLFVISGSAISLSQVINFMKQLHIPYMKSCPNKIPVTLKTYRTAPNFGCWDTAFHSLMKWRIKIETEKKTYWNIAHLFWEVRERNPTEWGKWGRALWNLVGTLFLARSKLNKADKQIMKDPEGPKCFPVQSLFGFGWWYNK